ncbi:MAG: universal stress protein [Janthinobacterium lividum]
MFKHILVPTDGSELSARAVEAAIELAKALDARLTAYACVAQYPITPFSEVVVEPPPDYLEKARAEARLHLEVIEQAARAQGVQCALVVSVQETPAAGIVEAAEQSGCDAIFMASHGRRGLSKLLIGSETERVLSHTSLPVVVYR